jgi:hypothetical protein
MKSAWLRCIGAFVVCGALAACRATSSTLTPPPLSSGSVSLAPDVPGFPVPAGSVLVNVQIDGSGTTAYRIATWQSGSGYDATISFYKSLSDSRWKGRGSSITSPDAADYSFSDAAGVFASCQMEISRTNPVKINTRFLPPGGVPAHSYAPGPTIAFGSLPAQTTLPEGFPAALVPSGATLADASSVGSTYYAIFSSSIASAVYQSQIAAVATVMNTATQAGTTVIDFTYDGHPGQVVVDPTSRQIYIEVTK